MDRGAPPRDEARLPRRFGIAVLIAFLGMAWGNFEPLLPDSLDGRGSDLAAQVLGQHDDVATKGSPDGHLRLDRYKLGPYRIR